MSKVEETNEYQRAHVATRYLLGVRGQDLLVGLQQPLPATERLVKKLSVDDRASRAATLAPELTRLVAAVERATFPPCAIAGTHGHH